MRTSTIVIKIIIIRPDITGPKVECIPEIQNKSGYYRIKDSKIKWTYCNMSIIQGSGDFISTCTGVGGGWRRIANINISAGDDCPGDWRKATQSGVSFCRKAKDGHCSSCNFSTNGVTQ